MCRLAPCQERSEAGFPEHPETQCWQEIARAPGRNFLSLFQAMSMMSQSHNMMMALQRIRGQVGWVLRLRYYSPPLRGGLQERDGWAQELVTSFSACSATLLVDGLQRIRGHVDWVLRLHRHSPLPYAAGYRNGRVEPGN